LSGRRPSIKDGAGFQTECKENTKANAHGKDFPQFVKGKAPMVHYNDAYIIYPKNYCAKNVHANNAKNAHVHHSHTSHTKASHCRHFNSHAKISQMPKKKTKTGPHMYLHTFYASYVLTNKSSEVVAKYVGPRYKTPRLVFGSSRCLLLMSKDPRPFRYLKTRPKLFV
jgi:hypothetical protein